MGNKLKEEYCKLNGYSSFNKYNINDYTKYLEQKISEEFLSIPDIRNKLTPITNMIALFEKGHINMIKLEEVKKSINYLADREVYELS